MVHVCSLVWYRVRRNKHIRIVLRYTIQFTNCRTLYVASMAIHVTSMVPTSVMVHYSSYKQTVQYTYMSTAGMTVGGTESGWGYFYLYGVFVCSYGRGCALFCRLMFKNYEAKKYVCQAYSGGTVIIVWLWEEAAFFRGCDDLPADVYDISTIHLGISGHLEFAVSQRLN